MNMSLLSEKLLKHQNDGEQEEDCGPQPFSSPFVPPLLLLNVPPFPVSIVEDGLAGPEPLVVELEQRELWQKMHQQGTEMFVTKSGRRLFPSLKVKLSGLNEKAIYSVFLDIVPCDSNVWHFKDSRWKAIAGEPVDGPQNPNPSILLEHIQSPATGAHWMDNGGISFHEIRIGLTAAAANNDLAKNNCGNGSEFQPPQQQVIVPVKPMHKYQPRVHVVRLWKDEGAETADCWPPKKVHSWTTVIFPETEFIAVTAYQNNQITELKIENNMFAKGLRSVRRKVGPSAERREGGEKKNATCPLPEGTCAAVAGCAAFGGDGPSRQQNKKKGNPCPWIRFWKFAVANKHLLVCGCCCACGCPDAD